MLRGGGGSGPSATYPRGGLDGGKMDAEGRTGGSGVARGLYRTRAEPTSEEHGAIPLESGENNSRGFLGGE